jgi:hypothetical protein
MSVKVPRQCPFVLLVREGKAFDSEEGIDMKSGASRDVEQGHTPNAFLQNSEF